MTILLITKYHMDYNRPALFFQFFLSKIFKWVRMRQMRTDLTSTEGWAILCMQHRQRNGFNRPWNPLTHVDYDQSIRTGA